jgi:hypothetical protein
MGVAALPYAALALTAVSAGVSAYGAAQSASAQSQAADYQAQVALNNQKIADQNAQVALQQGEQQEAAKREQTAQVISEQRAITAAAGIDPNQGSSRRIQGDTAALGELDAQTIRNNAARTAYGFRAQGNDFSGQASLLESQSASASSAGALGAFSSLIGGASSVANKWTTFNSQGVFG